MWSAPSPSGHLSGSVNRPSGHGSPIMEEIGPVRPGPRKGTSKTVIQPQCPNNS
jgi:hypothetical protein